MKVLEFHNHPLFDVENILKGYDIAVYIVDDTELKVSKCVLKNKQPPLSLSFYNIFRTTYTLTSRTYGQPVYQN